jgi:hypothetical protein
LGKVGYLGIGLFGFKNAAIWPLVLGRPLLPYLVTGQILLSQGFASSLIFVAAAPFRKRKQPQ